MYDCIFKLCTYFLQGMKLLLVYVKKRPVIKECHHGELMEKQIHQWIILLIKLISKDINSDKCGSFLEEMLNLSQTHTEIIKIEVK